jgi:hypothetical protein
MNNGATAAAVAFDCSGLYLGLGGKHAALTIHDMRSLLECIQFVRRTAVQTAVHVITTGVLIGLLTGIALKLRWFGPALCKLWSTRQRSKRCCATAGQFADRVVISPSKIE